MILYLLKSSAVLLVVLLFYKVFLEKEKAFVFNRSYLWLGLIFSFLSPLLVYEIPVDWTLVQEADVLGDWATGVQNVQYTERFLKEEQTTIDWFYLGSLVYIFLCGILMIRFIVNLSKMLYRVHSSEHRKEGKYRIVSNETIEAPFSFFNTIFLPENYDRSILEHEKRHADAYHSFDVIVLELIQIVFWINPLIFWHKRLVSLNHEFFADYQKNASNIKTYQKLIFSHISKNKDNLLASGFNYSFIKKRMIMLQRSRSGPLLWAKKVMVIPFFAILAFAACEKVEAQGSNKSNQDLATKSKLVVQFDGKSTNDIKVLSAKNNSILDNDDFTKLVLSDGLLAFDQVNFQVGSSVYKGKELHRIVFTKEKEELFVRKLDKNSSVIKVTTSEGRGNKKYRAIRLGPGENWSASYNGNEIPPPPPPPVAPPSPENSASFENIPPPPPPVHPPSAKAAPMSEPAPPEAPEPAAEPSPVPPPPPPPPSGWVKEPKTPKTPKVPKTPKTAKEPKAPKSPKTLKNEKIEKEIIKLKYEIESLYNEKSKNKEKQEQLKLKQTQVKQLQEKLKQIK